MLRLPPLRFTLALVAAATVPLSVRTAEAQRLPIGAAAGSPAAIADSLVMRGDTAAAMTVLTSAVKANFKDPAAWYLLGLINWERVKDVRSAAYIKDKNKLKMVAAADSSLRIATQLAPDSARYWLSLARFNIGSGYSTVLFASQGNAKEAYQAAESTGDNLLLAEAADLQGMAMWRRYEASANRGFTQDGREYVVEIKPGTSTEEWIIGSNIYDVPFEAGINTNTYKYYIDFASQNHIEYVILDEGWAVNKKADMLQVTVKCQVF